MSPVIILMTASNHDEARAIGRALVEERLAACCNIVGGVESIYRWEGKVEEASEVLVLIKTTHERFPELQHRVLQLHSYDIPELIALPISEGLPAYLAWMLGSMKDEV